MYVTQETFVQGHLPTYYVRLLQGSSPLRPRRDAGTSRKLWESVLAPHTPKGRSNGAGYGRSVHVTRRAHAHALDHLRPMCGIRCPPSVRRVVQLDGPQTRKK